MKTIIFILIVNVNLISCAQKQIAPFEKMILTNKNKKKYSFRSDSLVFEIGNYFNNKASAVVLRKMQQDEFILSIYTDLEAMTEIMLDTIEIGDVLDIKAVMLNLDNMNDLVVTTGNNRACNYVYVSKGKSYTRIDDCSKWPALKPISNKGFSYTYKNLGCSSNIWSSELLQIKDTSPVRLAKLIVNACEEDRLEIDIFQEKDSVKKEFKYSENANKLKDLSLFWTRFVNNGFSMNK